MVWSGIVEEECSYILVFVCGKELWDVNVGDDYGRLEWSYLFNRRFFDLF